MESQATKIEHRKYPRIYRAFPVKFQCLDEYGKPVGSILQGVTKNVARGGLLIESKLDREQATADFLANKTRIKVFINIPPSAPPVISLATVQWSAKVSEPEFNALFLGVKYDQINEAQQHMIESYIKRLHKRPRIFFYFFLLFTAFVIVFTYYILIVR